MDTDATGIDSARSAAAADAKKFLATLFDASDAILFRPLETWSENNKKSSRPIHKRIEYFRPGIRGVDAAGNPAWVWMESRVDQLLARMWAAGVQDNANIFFGVCPRHGGNGEYDQAFQIRTIRALWADIDHCTVEDAAARISAANLPAPSIIVSSGNGGHFYWLLETPFLISDAPALFPVKREFYLPDDAPPGSKKKSRLWWTDPETKEKTYLTPATRPKLSEQAQVIQDVLAGLAAKIGGDHTIDISRILRLPGTLNRKNARNGAEPRPCTLVHCDESARYPFEMFAHFAEFSPDKERRKTIEAIRTPPPAKKIGAKGLKTIADLINACLMSPPGMRSEMDFRLCCTAIEQGWPRADVWQQVGKLGKFAEGGERYFDLTWQKAEGHAKEKIYQEFTEKNAAKGSKKKRKAGESVPQTVTIGPNGEVITTAATAAATTATPTDAAIIEEKRVVDAIQIDVLGKLGENGALIFSKFHKRTERIHDVSKLTFPHLLEVGGPPVKARVMKGMKDDLPGMYSLEDVKESIALLAGYRPIGETMGLGAGCWQGMNEAGDHDDSIVLVGAREAAEITAAGEMTRITYPRCRGHLLEFDTGDIGWYDFCSLQDAYNAMRANPDLAKITKNDLINLWSKWRWKFPQVSPIVMAGLCLATWVQTLWDWRPQIAMLGPSQAGKTIACNALAGMFGPLCKKSSGSTAAGIRQTIKTSAKVILCDEFEYSKYRQEILEMLRAAGRGDAIFRGTTGQQAKAFSLRHMVWVAAIEVGLTREADKNRFVMLELDRPQKEKRGKLILPTTAELQDLGMRSLAAALIHIGRAKEIAAGLKDTRVEGVDGRIVESYAVPTAILAAIEGFDIAASRELLVDMLTQLRIGESGEARDESALMDAILHAHIFVHRESWAVSQVIESVVEKKDGWRTCAAALEKNGLKVDIFGDGKKVPADRVNEPCLVIAPKEVARHILKGTHWADQSIDQILTRVEGAIEDRKRVAGHRVNCVMLPMFLVQRDFLGVADPRELAEQEAAASSFE